MNCTNWNQKLKRLLPAERNKDFPRNLNWKFLIIAFHSQYLCPLNFFKDLSTVAYKGVAYKNMYRHM